MSEKKTTTELISEVDYQIDSIHRKNVLMRNEQLKIQQGIDERTTKLNQLIERRKSLISYLNTDSINQDKTE